MQNKFIDLSGLQTFLTNIKTYIEDVVSKKQDTLVSGTNIKTINNESILCECNIDIKNIIDITYSKLVSLRNNSKLIPGCFYRITDYSTSILDINNTVAGHDFDIIVKALNSNTLSEDASACETKRRAILNDMTFEYDALSTFTMNTDTWMRIPNNQVSEIPDGIKTILKEKGLSESDYAIYHGQFTKQCAKGLLHTKFQYKEGDHALKCIGVDIVSNGSVIDADYHEGSTGHNNSNNDYFLNVPKTDNYIIRFFISGNVENTQHITSKCDLFAKSYKTYFRDAKLENWDIKYCLDNDNTRFIWANTTNGKGVIYYMKDEYHNECPYDFKNILFNGFYTFSYTVDGTLYDGTVKYNTCYGNKMQIACNSENIRILNNNVFKNTSATSSCISNTFENDCVGNSFGDSCVSNAFGNYCKNNTFGNNCQYNTFDDYCQSNKFGDFVQSSTFGVYCTSNQLGSYMVRMGFGKQCMNNKFINSNSENMSYCRIITIGDQCNGVITKCNKDTSSGEWLQNINLGKALTGNVTIDSDLNNTRTLFVTKNANNEIYQYFESDIIDNLGKTDANVQAVDGDLIVDDIFVASGKQIVEITDDNIVLKPNKYYKKSNVSSNISIVTSDGDNNDIVQEYILEFTTSDTGTAVTLPDSIKWINGELPTFENACTYQLSIVNNLCVCAMFK